MAISATATATATAVVAERLYCSAISLANGEDPIGTAPAYDGFVVLEQGPPWPKDLWKSTLIPVSLPPLVDARRREGVVIKAVTVQPDSEYAIPDRRRVLFLRRAEGPIVRYDRQEYAVPDAEVDALLHAWLGDQSQLAGFERYAVGAAAERDILVCTHATIDAACGKFGYPLFVSLRNELVEPDAGTRVWRSSMIGGHRFAPTVLDLPEARYWGHLTDDSAASIANKRGNAADVHANYRGWCAARTAFEQVAEREVVRREGWDATRTATETVLLRLDASRRAHVLVCRHDAAGGLTHGYSVWVAPAGSVTSLHHSGPPNFEEFPQYAVDSIERLEPVALRLLRETTEIDVDPAARDELGKLVLHHDH
jgi:hypothetical protein